MTVKTLAYFQLRWPRPLPVPKEEKAKGRMRVEVDGLGQQTWLRRDAGEAGLQRLLEPVKVVLLGLMGLSVASS